MYINKKDGNYIKGNEYFPCRRCRREKRCLPETKELYETLFAEIGKTIASNIGGVDNGIAQNIICELSCSKYEALPFDNET